MEKLDVRAAAQRHLKDLSQAATVADHEVVLIDRRKRGMEAENAKLEREAALHAKAITAWNTMIETTAMQNLQPVIDTVNETLRATMPDQQLSLEVTPTTKRDRQVYPFSVRDGDITRKGVEGMGGGIYAICSFILRVLLIRQTHRANLIVLDEQLKAVSAEYKPRVSELLQKLAEIYGIHILMVTHDRDLAVAANNHYVVRKSVTGNASDGSTVTKVTIDDVQSYFEQRVA